MAVASLAALGLTAAQAQETIKVGVLHSLSGTMAISETVLKDTVLMAIDEIDAKGGLLGRKLEPVVVDPASNWSLLAEKGRQLISNAKVAVVFGCWTSVSRKSVLPVFEELNSLLFYPVQSEDEELSKNVFDSGAEPSQQAIPAVEYLMSKDGGSAKSFVLLGTDYVYPRTTNKILKAFLKSKGVADADIIEEYTPFGHSDYQSIIAKIKKFASEGKKSAVISTINGDSDVPFYKELGNQGLKATDVQVVAFSVREEELRGVHTKPLQGHHPRRLLDGSASVLRVEGRNQYYGGSHILRNLAFEARLGEVTVVLGRNGVGKTTLLKSLLGAVPVDAGTVRLDGVDITRAAPCERVRRGIGCVPQGREIFGRLTVEDNLLMGLASKPGGTAIPDELFELFPVLAQMIKRRGGDLSGGQQQRPAIARALAAGPKLLMLDEPTEGIQPSIIKDIGRVIRMLADRKTMAIVLVEQYYDFADELADQYLVMERGEVVMRGRGKDMEADGVRQKMSI